MVCVNECPLHLFGSLIGPTLLSSSKQGCHCFFFYGLFLLLVQSNFSPRICNWDQSFGVSQDKLKRYDEFQCYCLGLLKQPYAIFALHSQNCLSLNEHHPQCSSSLIVVRFTIALAHLCAFSMFCCVQCWDCCKYF